VVDFARETEIVSTGRIRKSIPDGMKLCSILPPMGTGESRHVRLWLEDCGITPSTPSTEPQAVIHFRQRQPATA
jgi:hypothetical protein